MSKHEINLCCRLLKENFGECVEAVGSYLMKQLCPRPLVMICKDISLPRKDVIYALRVLLMHNIAEYTVSNRGFVEYTARTNKVYLLYYPLYVYYAKIMFGNVAELILLQTLSCGRLTMSNIIKKVAEKCSESSAQVTPKLAAIKECFTSLVESKYLIRCAQTEPGKQKRVPNIAVPEKELYLIPEVKLYLLEKSEEPPQKRQKITYPDDGIYWRVNVDELDVLLRNRVIVSAVENSVDKKASELVRIVFQLSRDKGNYLSSTTHPISFYQISETVVKESVMKANELDSYLGILTDSERSFMSKADDRSGGMYVVNVKKSLERLAEEHAVSVVQERFGSKSSRIFRLLLKKKYLEQKKMEELAMISPKDAKEYTYRMLKESYIVTQEISKTPDYAASRTFFLFHVDMNQVCRMLLQKCYQATLNSLLCYESQKKEQKRVLEKKQRIDCIVTNLIDSGINDEEQIQEIRESITPNEKASLEKVKQVCEKLYKAVNQLADMIIILKMYLQYRNLK